MILFLPLMSAGNQLSMKSNSESAVLWNDGDKYTLSALPVEAQVSPVFCAIADDLDGDGNPDIWLGGNFYPLKPQIGRIDASKGVLLKGNGKRSFIYEPQPHDGLYVKGEVRDAAIIGSARQKGLLLQGIMTRC